MNIHSKNYDLTKEKVSKNLNELIEASTKFSGTGRTEYHSRRVSKLKIKSFDRAYGHELNIVSPMNENYVDMHYKFHYFLGYVQIFELNLRFDKEAISHVTTNLKLRNKSKSEQLEHSYQGTNIPQLLKKLEGKDFESLLKKEISKGVVSTRKIIKKDLMI